MSVYYTSGSQTGKRKEEQAEMSQINEIPMPDADIRIVPVILLVDVSGSMGDPVIGAGTDDGSRKITVVNKYMRLFFQELANSSDLSTELDACIIAFGTHADVILHLCAIDQAGWQDLTANGQTNLTEALEKAKEIIESRNMPKNCGRPSLLLISDGHPYPANNWRAVLEDFISNGRTARCDRFALGIGRETDYNMLGMFASKPEWVFEAQNVMNIGEFFRYVSTHTKAKTRAGAAPGSGQGTPAPGGKPFVTIAKPGNAPQKKNPFMS